MQNNQQLEFIVKAVDEASSNLEHVREAVAKLQGSVDSASTSMQKASGEMEKVSANHESMATSVFKGVASWDLLKESIKVTTDFLKESVDEFLDAQKKTDLTRSTIESMGMSFEKAQPQLDAFGEKMLRLGVDNEVVELSAAKLAKLAGGDLTKGINLAKLAADLAASGMGDLESNTNSLAGVLAGHGTMAIREFKLNLDQTATTADILNAIQAKVTQTTEQYADTVPGKIQVVTQAWSELKEEVGGAFITAMSNAIQGSNAVGQSLDRTKQIAQGLAVVVFELTNLFVLAGNAAASLGTMLGVASVQAENQKEIFQKTKLGLALVKDGQDQMNESSANFTKTLHDMIHPLEALGNAQTQAFIGPVKPAGELLHLWDGMANTQKAATANFISHTDATKLLTTAYHDMLNKTSTDLASMADDHNKSMSDIQKSISATIKSISDLNKAYSQQQTDDAAGMADKIVASQQKIVDLKKQLASTDENVKKTDIQKQIDTEQAGLDAVAEFTSQNATAITESKRRASLTQLQRDVEDYQKRKSLQTAEYNDKLASLQQQLADEQAKQTQELELYKQRTTKIAEFTKAATDDYITASQTRIQQTKDEVNQEIQAFAALASAISAVRTASASAVTTYSVPNFGGKREMGGPVQMKTSYLVGERGPEIFVPSSDGTIVPNHALGSGGVGGGNVYVNVTGNTISDQVGVKYLADKVGAEIMRVLRLNQKVSI